MKETFSKEKSSEHIPTPEEVKSMFEQFIGEKKYKEKGKEYKEVRKLGDQQGLYLWDITIPIDSLRGEAGGGGMYAEYSYMRKGKYKEGSATKTAIHVTFFDHDDMPKGGHCVANFINNKWVLIK